MRSQTQMVIGSVVGIGILMIFILGFHVGGTGVLRVGLYSQLIFMSFVGAQFVLPASPLHHPSSALPSTLSKQLYTVPDP